MVQVENRKLVNRIRVRKAVVLLALCSMVFTSGGWRSRRAGSSRRSADHKEVTVNQSEQLTGSSTERVPETGTILVSPELTSKEEADRARTTYEIFVYSYRDSSGDGIGDLNGIRESLDYLQDRDPATDTDLGINEIWLTPIFPSPTYHKYDTTDYMQIDEQFGTMEDFENLVTACHERGIRILLDLAFNHTSVEHSWFKQASAYLKEHAGAGEADGNGLHFPEEDLKACPSLSYYHFASEKRDGYEKLEGTDYYYEARFWSGMPDLNLDDEQVRAEITAITGFWLAKGADGFRLDAVTSYYTDEKQKNIEFLIWLNETVKSQKEDAYLVGECWADQQTYADYYASGVDSFFDFQFAGQEGIIANVVRGNKGASVYAEALEASEKLYCAENPDYINAPFYTNHDMARSAGYYSYDDGSRTKIAEALNLLMPGNAFLYYGEELGMKGSGKDENKRAPMLWTTEDEAEVETAAGICDGPPAMDNVKQKFEGAAEQQKDPDSIWNYCRQVIAVRNAYPVIAEGTTTVISELSGEQVCAFTRNAEGYEPLLILINTSEEMQTLDLTATEYAEHLLQPAAVLTVGEEAVRAEGNTVKLPGFGILILKK